MEEEELSCSNSWPNYSNCQSMDVAWQNKFKIPSIWQNSEMAEWPRDPNQIILKTLTLLFVCRIWQIESLARSPLFVSSVAVSQN